MQITEIKLFQTSLTYMSVKDLTVEELRNILKIKKQLDTTVKDYTELIREIMKKYDIVGTNDSFAWHTHSEVKEIDKDINTLNISDYPIEGLNSLDASKIKLREVDNIVLIESLMDNLAK